MISTPGQAPSSQAQLSFAAPASRRNHRSTTPTDRTEALNRSQPYLHRNDGIDEFGHSRQHAQTELALRNCANQNGNHWKSSFTLPSKAVDDRIVKFGLQPEPRRCRMRQLPGFGSHFELTYSERVVEIYARLNPASFRDHTHWR